MTVGWRWTYLAWFNCVYDFTFFSFVIIVFHMFVSSNFQRINELYVYRIHVRDPGLW